MNPCIILSRWDAANFVIACTWSWYQANALTQLIITKHCCFQLAISQQNTAAKRFHSNVWNRNLLRFDASFGEDARNPEARRGNTDGWTTPDVGCVEWTTCIWCANFNQTGVHKFIKHCGLWSVSSGMTLLSVISSSILVHVTGSHVRICYEVVNFTTSNGSKHEEDLRHFEK